MAEKKEDNPSLEERFSKIADELSEGNRSISERVVFVAEDSPKYWRIKTYPDLGDSRIKTDPFSGFVYVESWRTRKAEAEVAELKEENAGMQVIGRRPGRVRKPDEKARLIWFEHTNIESVIRQSAHILEENVVGGDDMVERTKEMMSYVGGLISRLKTEGISLDFDEIAEETEKILEKTGFASARKPRKRRIVGRLRSAVTGRDSRGIYNYLILQSQVYAAELDILRESIFEEKVEEKFLRILTNAYIQRHLERSHIYTFLAMLQSLSKSRMDEGGKLAVLEEVARKNLNSNMIRVAPYRRAALGSHYYLFGNELITRDGEVSERENKLFFNQVVKGLVDEENFEILQRDYPPLGKMYKEGPRYEFTRHFDFRTRNVVSLLNRVLEQGDNDLPEEFQYPFSNEEGQHLIGSFYTP